jgi:hypothetical protein
MLFEDELSDGALTDGADDELADDELEDDELEVDVPEDDVALDGDNPADERPGIDVIRGGIFDEDALDDIAFVDAALGRGMAAAEVAAYDAFAEGALYFALNSATLDGVDDVGAGWGRGKGKSFSSNSPRSVVLPSQETSCGLPISPRV